MVQTSNNFVIVQLGRVQLSSLHVCARVAAQMSEHRDRTIPPWRARRSGGPCRSANRSRSPRLPIGSHSFAARPSRAPRTSSPA
eukprot:12694119-Alexandrium_andersonii.AAC.1